MSLRNIAKFYRVSLHELILLIKVDKSSQIKAYVQVSSVHSTDTQYTYPTFSFILKFLCDTQKYKLAKSFNFLFTSYTNSTY